MNSKSNVQLIRKPEGKFKCSQCGKSYKYNSGLWTHKTYECGKTPQFHCNICKKNYTRKDSLIQHSMILHQQYPANL